MRYPLKRLGELVFVAGPKPMRTEFGIQPRLESCEVYLVTSLPVRRVLKANSLIVFSKALEFFQKTKASFI